LLCVWEKQVVDTNFDQMSAFLAGFTAFFRGMAFSITRLGVWYLVPLIVWLFMVVGLSLQISDWLIPHLYRWIELQTGLDLSATTKGGGLEEIFKVGLQMGVVIVVKIMLWYVMSRYMKYMVIILLSPLFAYISEQTEALVTGKSYPFSFVQILKDALRGAGIAVRNMLLETLLMIAGGIISFFLPLLSPLILVALFLVNSYFMAFNFFDYVAERKKMGVSKSVRYMRANMSTLLGFGVAYNLIAWFPLLDWILAPISAASGAVLADTELPHGKSSATFML
jgi:CysZ protein